MAEIANRLDLWIRQAVGATRFYVSGEPRFFFRWHSVREEAL